MHVPCEEIAPKIHYRSGFVELRGAIETCTLCRVLCIIDYCCPHCYTIYIDIRYPTVSACSITSAFAADIHEHAHIERYSYVLTLNDRRNKFPTSYLSYLDTLCVRYIARTLLSTIFTEFIVIWLYLSFLFSMLVIV